MKNKLTPIISIAKTGQEQLTYNNSDIGYSLQDFWIWSVSDILSNTARGRFAEFIVGTTLNLDPQIPRNEWDAFDLKTPEGVKIEIKSAAYIQSWNQKDFSKISFSIKSAKYWDPVNNTSNEKPKRHADVYVFCLLNHKDQDTIDPLKAEQWEFYVLPTYRLDNYERSQSSITLTSLRKLTSPILYGEIKTSIQKAFQEQINNE